MYRRDVSLTQHLIHSDAGQYMKEEGEKPIPHRMNHGNPTLKKTIDSYLLREIEIKTVTMIME